jgi:hypothetical protein
VAAEDREIRDPEGPIGRKAHKNMPPDKRRIAMKAMATFISILMIFLFARVALAQDPIVFPAEGQSQEQIEKDQFSCYQWALLEPS